jgi:hypothetical protein
VLSGSSTAFTTHYRGGPPRRRGRGAMRKTSSTAQPMQGRGLTATSMRTTALGSTYCTTEWATHSAHKSRARGPSGGGGFARALAVYNPHPHPPTRSPPPPKSFFCRAVEKQAPIILYIRIQGYITLLQKATWN